MNILLKTKHYINLKILIKSMCVVTVFLLVFNIAGFEANCNHIRQNVLRLHILANSDSAEDQALKLKVRDAVLTAAENVFENCESEQQAEEAARQNIEKIKDVARKTIAESGYDYEVEAKVCNMWFENRVYDNFTLPAGNYEAVRVEIGKAEGKNWWCVMFPSVCLPSAEANKGLDSALTKEETEMCEKPENYVVKFKVVEIFERCRNEMKNWLGF